jgi:hypothetical protein
MPGGLQYEGIVCSCCCLQDVVRRATDSSDPSMSSGSRNTSIDAWYRVVVLLGRWWSEFVCFIQALEPASYAQHVHHLLSALSWSSWYREPVCSRSCGD